MLAFLCNLDKARVFACGAVLLLGFSCSRPLADFTYSGQLTAPAKVEFINRSQKAESFIWDFGDGNTSTQQYIKT